MIKSVKKAVIPVAGLGTRMLPATKAIPKELLPVYDRPIIEHVVREAIAGDITEIILVTRSGKEAIENHFDAHYELEHRLENKGKKKILGSVKNIIPSHVKVISIRQADALGLGHAVLCAKHLLNNEPFAVLLPDVLVLDRKQRSQHYSFTRLVGAWNQTGIGQVMVERVNPALVERYGIVDIDGEESLPFKSMPLKGLVEKPFLDEAPSNLAVLGRYVLPSRVLDLLERTDAGVDLLRLDGLNALETDAEIHDCGNKQGFLTANLSMGLRDYETREKLIQIFRDFD